LSFISENNAAGLPRVFAARFRRRVRKVAVIFGGRISELQRGGVALQIDLSADDIPILGDRIQLQQVLLNLVRNGIEAMSTISDRPRVLRIRSEPRENGEALVAVEDTGVGLDPVTADRIFDPLFTTKLDGMGMGLSICRSIVEAHRGRLWASPTLAHGTVLRFTVPLAAAVNA
jgi:signal transduction histidine kinase